ncbi:hypothetical protein K503DRAFT_787405 [Rhizopogon vinicolor AM-OR11-026]|uniref:asparaginase n=1 Tax=Rhizopogon vinicolor AM-OR11-026 TaxID=1314800 RepID=A0A1B7MHP3_9AGAM|nr:hypothetical protein K503DRAFT_787405 [Rhizopogon vinicolor AM-OR11-026]
MTSVPTLAPYLTRFWLETFGIGNTSKYQDFLAALKEACDRGVVIVAISQCAKGTMSGDYETGRILIHSGIVPDEPQRPKCDTLFFRPVGQVVRRVVISLPVHITSVVSTHCIPSDKEHTNLQGLLSQFIVKKRCDKETEISELLNLASGLLNLTPPLVLDDLDERPCF